jgi:hypothetical protein
MSVPPARTQVAAPERGPRAEPPQSATIGRVTSVNRIRCWTAAGAAAVRSRAAATVALGLCGAALEFALVRGWLAAFSLAGHPGFPAVDQDPIVWLLDDGNTGMVRWLVLLAAAFVPYVLALAVAQRAQGRIGLGIAFAGSVILGATMLASFPAGALDIFHNIMDGRLVWAYHLNPIVVAPSAVSGDPLYPYLHYWWNTTTAYGPLWFLVTLPAYLAAGNGLIGNIVAYKALPFAFELAALVFIFLIALRINPRATTAAIVYAGWNPLILWEVAGNGHNDIVMMCFVLAAILLLLTSRWPFAFPVLACSVLVKYVSIALLPLFVVWILLRYGRKALWPLAFGLAGAVVVSLAITFHFWAGAATIAPLRDQQNYFIFSPASALIGSWGELLSNTPKVTLVKHTLTLAFVVLYALVLVRLRRNPVSLIQASIATMFLLLVLMSWWFWPWYVVWGLALAALLPTSAYGRLFVVFSVTAMLIYLSSPWRLEIWNLTNPMPLPLGNLLIVFLPPVLYAAMQLIGPGAASEPA